LRLWLHSEIRIAANPAELRHFRGPARPEAKVCYLERLFGARRSVERTRLGLTLEKNYCYEPQAVNTGGRILVHVFQDLDPTIAVLDL
jgi:hypothetical protein